MAWVTRTQYVGNNVQTVFTVGFPYLAGADVKVFLDDTEMVLGVDYTFNTATTITFTAAPGNGVLITFRRITDRTAPAGLQNGATPSTTEINRIITRNTFIVQEAADAAIEAGTWISVTGSYDATGQRIINLASGSNAGDAVNKGQLDTKQPLDATLTALAGVNAIANKVPYFIGTDSASVADFTSFGRTVVACANATALLNAIGAGSLALLSTVNNGNWSGTALAIANGGTGATTAASARAALLPSAGAPQDGQVLSWDNTLLDSKWISVGGTGTITSISADRGARTSTGAAITSSGSIYGSINTVAKSSNWAFAIADRGTRFEATGSITGTLPAASGIGGDWYCYVHNRGTGSVNIAAASLINGAASVALSPGMAGIITCNGSTYSIMIMSRDAVPTGSTVGYPGAVAPDGWVLLAGRTIGNASSGASERAGADTQDLFVKLYTETIDGWAPVSGGRSGSNSAAALADFSAGKTLQLPDLRGRSLIGSDNMGGSAANRVNGNSYNGINADKMLGTGGEQTHQLTENELAVHNHGAGARSAGQIGQSGSTRFLLDIIDTDDAGGDQPHNNMPPWLAMSVIMKL